MKSFHPIVLVVFLAAAVVAALPVLAVPATQILGSDGEVYRLSSSVDSAGNPTLTVTIERPDGAAEHLVVPATEGRGVESSPHLVYEQASRTLFIAWEERLNYIHSLIHLVGLRNGEWTDVIEVSEGSFGFKGEPRLATTHDSYVIGLPDGSTRTVARTVLHVVWVEERSEGQFLAYAPVTLLDGEYIGQRKIFDVSAMVAVAEPALTDVWQVAAPTITPADDDHSVNLAFVHPAGGRLTSLRITMLPGELTRIADELRNHLIDIGVRHEWGSPDGLTRLADELRNHLIDIGVRLDPQIRRHVADGLRNHLIDIGVQYPPTELVRMAGALRNHLIDIGFRLDDRGLRRMAAANTSHSVIEVAVEGGGDEPSLTSQVARVTTIEDWARPTEASGDSILLVSRSGQAALVSWTDGKAVFYRETFGGEWSPVVRLPLGDSLGAEQATSLLQNRIRNR